MYGGAALVTGSLVYWYEDLADFAVEGFTAALTLAVGGVALLVLAHTGAVASRRRALLLVINAQ